MFLFFLKYLSVDDYMLFEALFLNIKVIYKE